MRFYIGVHILLTTLAIEVSCDCGIITPSVNPSIISEGGAERATFPWHVFIRWKPSGSSLPKCAGILISSSVVITAAHCFSMKLAGPILDASEFAVFTDRSDSAQILPGRDVQESDIKIRQIAKGFKRTRGFYSADIAWLILENPFNLTSSVSPVCLDFNNEQNEEGHPSPLIGQMLYQLLTANMSDSQLNKMNVIVHNHDNCISMIPEYRRSLLPVDTLCAIFQNTSKIYFERGGGFYSQHNGRWYVRGIVGKAIYSQPNLTQDIFLPLTNIRHFVDEMIRSRIFKKCGLGPPAEPLIVDGVDAILGEFPWHVAVYRKNSTGFHEQICAGALISSNVVVSAAHCFFDDISKQKQDPSKFAVAAGKNYRLYDWPERFVQKSPVDTIHLPSTFYGIEGLFAADIAWLIIQRPFILTQYVTPICLNPNNWNEIIEPQVGQVGKVAGWGVTADESPSLILQKMNAPFISFDQCTLGVPPDFRPYLTIDKFCAGYLNGTSLCQGDSGGGLFFYHNHRWYLRGIVSVGPRDGNRCKTDSYTAFTDIGRYFDELRRFTNISPYDFI